MYIVFSTSGESCLFFSIKAIDNRNFLCYDCLGLVLFVFVVDCVCFCGWGLDLGSHRFRVFILRAFLGVSFSAPYVAYNF